MILLEQMVEIGEQDIFCTLTVHEQMPYADADGNLPAWMGLELMAQATAAWKAYHARNGNAPAEIGFLVGVRLFTAFVPSFQRGSRIEVRVHQVLNTGRMGQVEGTIRCGEEVLATAVFSAYLPTPEELALLTSGAASSRSGAAAGSSAGRGGGE
jgi:predicted hotdog family 3-hydroxylacyl-ACP dehydratase